MSVSTKRNRRRSWRGPSKLDAFLKAFVDVPGGLTVTDLETRLGMSTAMVRSYLYTLSKRGLICRQDEVGSKMHERPELVGPEEAVAQALLALEAAMASRAIHQGITPESDAAFQRYQKIKARAIRPTGTGEDRVALRMALLELIKMLF
jgi:DNA-binding GntR family transcriptional regulator